jgi:uncharacterized membrane protein YhaH (DUF805 family)
VSLLSGRWPRKTFNFVLISSCIAAYILIEISPFFNIVIELFGIEALQHTIVLLSVLLNIGFVLIVILRLHDLNRSGWWSILGFIPFVNVLFAILLMVWPSASIENRYKKMLITLAKIFTLVIFSVLLLQVDDDLSSEVTEYVSLIENRVSNGSEAYLYLNGITAPEEKQILSQGSRLLTRYNNYSKNIFEELSDADKLNKDEKINLDEKLTTPDYKNKMYCALSDAGCLGKIIASSSDWENEMNKFSFITKRYEKFISYSEFTTLTKPHAASPYPASHYLTSGNKIKIFSALSLARSGKAEEAMQMLLNDNRYLRKHLALADNIIHKLIFINLFSNNLDIIVYIHSAYKLEKLAKITHLSKSEMSMKYPLIREFIMEYNTYLDADRNPDGWNGLPGWMVRVIFKPNMTINKRVMSYKDIISLSNLSAKAFVKSVINIESAPKSKPNYRNYAGSIITEEPITYFSQYIAKLHDLNAKISLANFVLSNKTQPLESPYGPLYDKTIERDNFICLDGPLEDKNNLRCIRKKI